MSHRGEKIITLAREMLRAEHLPEQRQSEGKISMSFRALCIATLVAALGGASVSHYISDNRRPINRYERVELDALVFYAARVKGLNEDNLRKDIEARAGASDFGDFSARDYRNTKSYLQDKLR